MVRAVTPARVPTSRVFTGGGSRPPPLGRALGFDFDIVITPGLFFDLFFPRGRQRRTRGGRPPGAPRFREPRRPRFPLPDVPAPRPPTTPAPFPTPSAPRPPTLGNIVLRGVSRLGGLVGVVLIAKDIIDLQKELERERRREAKEADARREAQRAADRLPPREVVIPGVEGAPVEQETVFTLPPRPQLPEIVTETLPDVIAQPVPGTRPRVPQTVGIPEISPTPVEIPAPAAPRAPARAPARPVLPLPLPLPGTFPSPTRPLTSPLSPATTPIQVPRPITPTLTGIQPIELTSIGTALQPSTQLQGPTRTAQQECQIVQRRRRRKGKCREGFFREFPGSTKFTTWREVDCVEQPFRSTRRVLQRVFS